MTLGQQFKEYFIDQTKQELETTMKKTEIIAKLPHLIKTTGKKKMIEQGFFSLLLKKNEKKIPASKKLTSIHVLHPRDQNHYSNLTSKIMKLCQILKIPGELYQINSK